MQHPNRSRNNLLHRQLDICADIFVYFGAVDNTTQHFPFHDDSSISPFFLAFLFFAPFYILVAYTDTFTLLVGSMWWMPKRQKCRSASELNHQQQHAMAFFAFCHCSFGIFFSLDRVLHCKKWWVAHFSAVPFAMRLVLCCLCVCGKHVVTKSLRQRSITGDKWWITKKWYVNCNWKR